MKNSLKMVFFFTLLTGLLYPLLVTAIAQLFFKDKANGSLIVSNGKIIGSELIGQNFKQDKYFFSRPSASEYSALPSGATNLAPISKDLKKRISDAKFKSIDLITTSASGLDPHESMEAILEQLPRVISARALNPVQIDSLKILISQNLEEKTLGFLGQARINVLKLNIELDKLH